MEGALVGGVCFIVPGLVVILGLSAVFLAHRSPSWVRGIAAGAGAGVPAVAVNAALGLLPASRRRAKASRGMQWRWLVYLLAGGTTGALAGQYLVVVLLACGLAETGIRHPGPLERSRPAGAGFPLAVVPTVAGGLGALAFVAFKVGALSYGGGFVIIPLMQHDVVSTYHWMTNAQFLNAVALGQITPGPVVLTVAVVGYAAGGIPGGLLASFVAFAPSFVFVMSGGRHFDRLRGSTDVQAFLTGAGAAAIGGIGGAAIPLVLGLSHLWQIGVTAVAVVWLIPLRKGVVTALIGCGVLGAIAALAHAPLS